MDTVCGGWMQIRSTIWKTVRGSTIRPSVWLSYSPTGCLFKASEISTPKRCLHTHIYCGTVHNDWQAMKPVREPINKLADKKMYICPME